MIGHVVVPKAPKLQSLAQLAFEKPCVKLWPGQTVAKFGLNVQKIVKNCLIKTETQNFWPHTNIPL